MSALRMATHVALGIAAAATFMAIGAALAQGTTQHRVCLDYDLPAEAYREFLIGYHARPSDAARAAWFEAHAQQHWLLRVPRLALNTAYSGTGTLPLHDISLDLQLRDGALLSTSLLVRQAGWHGAPEPVPEAQCRRYGIISGESAQRDRMMIWILSHTFGMSRGIPAPPLSPPCENDKERVATRRTDLDFDGFEACAFAPLPGQSPVRAETVYRRADNVEPFAIICSRPQLCRLISKIDGWHVWVSFDERRKTEWRALWRTAAAYLDRVTISRTPAASD